MKKKIIIAVIIAVICLMFGIGLGSVYISPLNIIRILGYKFFGVKLPEDFNMIQVSILWNLRLPRALLAFIVGAALSVSGAVMQSVLRNPLASSYTLGVSSGASLGAGMVILLGITVPMIQVFTLPIFGFIFGLGTIILAIAVSSRFDIRLENNTIILTGMVFSLFISSIITLLMTFKHDHMQRLIYWQMGTFSSKNWSAVLILLPVLLICSAFILNFNKELDIMTFGEEQSAIMGINIKKVKWVLLVLAAAETGAAISFSGIVGFIDLVAPHVVRRIYGSKHCYVIPMSLIAGGSFMVVCDLISRTLLAPQEIPVGAVTSLIGAPFFAYIYFSKRK